MRNNAAYLPENPIVYIIFPESIHNRASFIIFVRTGCIFNTFGSKNTTFGHFRAFRI